MSSFFPAQLKHEVRWEALSIPPYRLIQHLGLDFIEDRQILIENHLLAANQDNGVGNPLQWNHLGSCWLLLPAHEGKQRGRVNSVYLHSKVPNWHLTRYALPVTGYRLPVTRYPLRLVIV